MKKHTFNWHGDDYYLLGVDKDGTKYYLCRGTFDCDWYWSGGYINTFSNNKTPEKSKDINSHQHYDSFFDLTELKNVAYYDAWQQFLKQTPLTKKEWWTLHELLRTFYTLSRTMEIAHLGGSHITTNPLKDKLQNKEIYDYYKQLISELHEEIHRLMSDTE